MFVDGLMFNVALGFIVYDTCSFVSSVVKALTSSFSPDSNVGDHAEGSTPKTCTAMVAGVYAAPLSPSTSIKD